MGFKFTVFTSSIDFRWLRFFEVVDFFFHLRFFIGRNVMWTILFLFLCILNFVYILWL